MKFSGNNGGSRAKDNTGDWMDHRPGVDRSRHPTTKQVRECLREARRLLPECIAVLRDDFLRDKKAGAASRLRAIGMLLDRGLGKPVQQQVFEDRQPIEQLPPRERIELLEEALEEERAREKESLQ